MRTLILALAACAALAAAGVAIADHNDATGVTPAAATFTAAPTADTKTQTCTDAKGDVWHITHGVYQGTATGDAALTGAITIRTESVIDTTTGYGWTNGHVRLADSSGHATAEAQLTAVNTHNGILNGFLTGEVKGAGRLLANVNATFSSDGSSLSGELGGTSPTDADSAVYAGRPGCAPGEPSRPEHH